MIDCHVHTAYSADAAVPAEEIIESAVAKGVTVLALTDHLDYEMENRERLLFEFDIDAYIKELSELREAYADRIRILIGVELGLQPHLAGRHGALLAKYPFDYVIGSQHVVFGQDPYDREVFLGRSEESVILRFFEETLENIRAFPYFDALGHPDYILRYTKAAAEGKMPDLAPYGEIIDEILRELIRNGIALELNSAGIRQNGSFNPHPDILKRYRELGGTAVTFGSDAHRAEMPGHAFPAALALLSELGFEELSFFEGRKPCGMPLKNF